jgi:hypothetical protein
MTMKTTMISGLGLLLAVGCTGSVETNPSGSGGNSSSSSSSDSGATTGGSTGSGGACAGFEDTPGAAIVTVRFVNKTGLPVYLPGRCQGIDYPIVPTSGSDGVTYNYEASCLQTCADLQTSPPFVCGLCAPSSYLLAVGATREITWEGTGLKGAVPMPSACWAEPQTSGTCPQIVAAPAASYAIQGLGYSACGAGCACDAKGLCSGTAEGQQAHADPVKFNFPAQNVVEVVFNVCAFGCPGG